MATVDNLAALPDQEFDHLLAEQARLTIAEPSAPEAEDAALADAFVDGSRFEPRLPSTTVLEDQELADVLADGTTHFSFGPETKSLQDMLEISHGAVQDFLDFLRDQEALPLQAADVNRWRQQWSKKAREEAESAFNKMRADIFATMIQANPGLLPPSD